MEMVTFSDNANKPKADITREERHNTLLYLLGDRHGKLLSGLFEDDNRHCSEISNDVDKAEINRIISNICMSGRSIDPTSTSTAEASSSLFRCISKEIFGTERYFDIVENLYTHAPRPDSDSLPIIAPRSDSDDVDKEYSLQIIANVFQCFVYVISLSKEKGFPIWREFKPDQRICTENIQSRDKCGGKFYITLYYSTNKHFHRVVATDLVCNCLLDPPCGSEKCITTINKKG